MNQAQSVLSQSPTAPLSPSSLIASASRLLDWWESIDRPLKRLPRAGALALLAALAGAMVWSALIVEPIETVPEAPEPFAVDQTSGESTKGDLALYRRIADRMASGESYYAAATTEQRDNNYPTRPFVTVRPPTLAWMQYLVGIEGVRFFSIGLLGACLIAFYTRFATRMSMLERVGGLLFILIGGLAATIPVAGLVHGIISGLLLTFAFFAYDPKRYWPSLIAAGLAIAIREIAIPFVLLWFVYSAARGRWREAAWIGAVIIAFAFGLYLHYLGVEAHSFADEPQSQGWKALAGYGLPISAVVKTSLLQLIPFAIAAPLALLPLLGWLGLGGRAGLFASLWFLGHATALALFARPENFYWIQLILPAYAVGLALAPRALYELCLSAFSRPSPQS